MTSTKKTPHAGGRPRNPESDEAIINAVLDLVANGATLSGLSLVMIASQAGVSRNALYRRWKSKEDLYLDVLATIGPPAPENSHGNAFDDISAHLESLISRTLNRRSNQMLRALTAEAEHFPKLNRLYFENLVIPRRIAMNEALERGMQSGELRSDLDAEFLTELLVSPVLVRMFRGDIESLDPKTTSREITALMFSGAMPRD
jgi:AcrR family transcriptional regulator